MIVYHGGTEIVDHPVAKAFDYIEGGVANDRVVDTVNLYMAGLMDKATALRRFCQSTSQTTRCAYLIKK